jgi:signal transduction histidine kinase
MSTAFLAQLPLFAGLSADDLDRLYDMAETVTLKRGESVMEEGSEGDALYVALSGSFEVWKRSGEREVIINRCGPGEIFGEMSLLENTPRMATVRAVTDSTLLRISQGAFEQLLMRSPQAAQAVLRTVTTRLRNTETLLRQSEKMAALGTLSAGLAHELNNPAAAVKRSAGQLREVIARWQHAAAHLSASRLDAGQIERVNALRSDLPQRAAVEQEMDALARSDAEYAVQTFLEDRGVEEAWELGPTLVEMGFSESELGELVRGLDETQTAALLEWLGIGSAVYALLDEVHQGAERISEIVKAVKQYSYLDQAPVQLVNLHEGLDNTLVILKHKLKQGVTVRREYDRSIPRVEAYASELNQVWTNLIDNAVDAMDGKGEIVIRTRGPKALEGLDQRVQVEISDNGPGIPPEVQPRIFDAFFTTKEPGVGTGLGLHISYNIIVQKHYGDISVRSKPGETTFIVTLPTTLPDRPRE